MVSLVWLKDLFNRIECDLNSSTRLNLIIAQFNVWRAEGSDGREGVGPTLLVFAVLQALLIKSILGTAVLDGAKRWEVEAVVS